MNSGNYKMQIVVGKDTKTGEPVIVDTLRAINGHLQITGVTGMGKTHTLVELISSLVESAAELGRPLRVHVFDPHEDIKLPYASVKKFSEATKYGYNPLEINPDPDYGGVRQAMQKFIAAIKKQKSLGTKQEAVMRYLLEDLYAARGFKADDPRTWEIDDPNMVSYFMQGREGRVYLDVTYEQRVRFKELLRDPATGQIRGGFDDFGDDPEMAHKKCWWVYEDHYDGDFLMWEPRALFRTAPTIDDLVRFTERKLKAHFCGANSACMALLSDVNQTARVYHRKVSEMSKRGSALSEADKKAMQDEVNKAMEKASGAFNSYLAAIVTGRELDDVIRYNSIDVLTSVFERVQNLRAIGIYNEIPPDFNPAMPIWQYVIKPLEIPVQSMFVDMVCARIFERSMQRGLQDDVVEVIVLDEGKRYVTETNNDILNKIANEARKFGLGLWIVSQTPAHFTDDFIKATGTILVMGLAKADTSLAARKLGLDESLLNAIVPQQTALIQVKNKAVLAADFRMVTLG